MPWSDQPCKLWTGANNGRYGCKWFEGRMQSTHRIAWQQAHGPIPAGMYVCHHCDTPLCYEETHLFLGTPSDNRRDQLAKGRDPLATKTHCVHGHEFTPENTRRDRDGARFCGECLLYRNRSRALIAACRAVQTKEEA